MKPLRVVFIASLTLCTLIHSVTSWAEVPGKPESAPHIQPLITPTAPPVQAKAYILVDADSGKVIAEKNSLEKLPPASLTKMMTLYVVSKALQNGQIHLDDKVRISKDAWQTGGSRMFVKEGDEVRIGDLLKGIIVASGNDACTAIAEHLGGSESGFADLMNQQAQILGMKNSHFTGSNGLPDPNLYTTAHDLSLLARALVRDFPQFYGWYKEKWFTYNGIRQPNRNRLLWHDNTVDGIKTGHTDEAGFCLVASAKRGNMRLVSVVLGEPGEGIRADDSQRLLNYGFRFFETHPLFSAQQTVATVPVYFGGMKTLPLGLPEKTWVTIPSGQSERMRMIAKTPAFIRAPVSQGAVVGTLEISMDGKAIASLPLVARSSVDAGSFFSRMKDHIALQFKQWFGHTETQETTVALS